MPKYERESDNVDTVLKATHETVGQLRTLLDNLSQQINALETELGPQRRKGL